MGQSVDRATIGQVWLWLAPGSGIWWNTGKSWVVNTAIKTVDGDGMTEMACTSLGRLGEWWSERDAEFVGTSCADARMKGYDSIQFTSSFCGHSYEVVDCRGVGRLDEATTWTEACPPPHVQLMKGLPIPRYAPALGAGASGPASRCFCSSDFDHINCDGAGISPQDLDTFLDDGALQSVDRSIWAMWSPNYWGKTWRQLRAEAGSSKSQCWASRGGADTFFADALSGKNCDKNWLDGFMGGPDSRPYWTSTSPPLFGFEGSLYKHCKAKLGETGYVDEPGNVIVEGQMSSGKALAETCFKAGFNILRLALGWDMCMNFEWEMCALQGKLPGQKDSTIRFAAPPRMMQKGYWSHPAKDRQALSDDVTFAEVFIMYTLCANRADLFTVNAVEPFNCNVDAVAYKVFTEKLRNFPGF